MFEMYNNFESKAKERMPSSLKSFFKALYDTFQKIYKNVTGKSLMPEGLASAYSSFVENNNAQTNNSSSVETNNGILRQQEIENEEYREVERRYKGTDQWMKAPNGKPTNLTERQWVQVRTPSFIKWFGDWLKAFKINNLIRSKALDISSYKTTAENAKEVYKAIGSVTNEDTNMNVAFVNKALGKIIRHKGYDPRLIGALKELFASAILMNEEKPDFTTPRADGSIHKQKNNIISFTHFINKVEIDGKSYFVRYTVQNLRTRKPDGIHEFHSQQLTDIKISNADIVSALFLQANPPAVASDLKLASFLKEVNDCSKVVDENGEPLVVYHGAKHPFFDTFNMGKSEEERAYENVPENTAWFTSSKEVAKTYSANGSFESPIYQKPFEEDYDFYDDEGGFYGATYSVFLNIRNPYTFDFKNTSFRGFATRESKVEYLTKKGKGHGKANYRYDEYDYVRNGDGSIRAFETREDAEAFIRANNLERSRIFGTDRRVFDTDTNYEAKKAKATGLYDGAIFRNVYDVGSYIYEAKGIADDYVVFNSDQIKSATDNIGTFSTANDSILYQSSSPEENVAREFSSDKNASQRYTYAYFSGMIDAGVYVSPAFIEMKP